MPSGTAITAAITKPPTTRQTVMPMSSAKPCSASSVQPDRSMVTGRPGRSSRRSRPAWRTPTRRRTATKKATPRADPAPRARPRAAASRAGYLMKLVSNSVSRSGICLMMPISSSSSAASLLKAWISPAKNFLLASRSCQREVRLRLLELLAALLDVGAHDLEGLLRVGLDHLERLRSSCRPAPCTAFGFSLMNFGVQPKVSNTIG